MLTALRHDWADGFGARREQRLSLATTMASSRNNPPKPALRLQHSPLSLNMVFTSRYRLLQLAQRDYRPNAWRRQDDLDELLSEVSLCSLWTMHFNHRCRVVSYGVYPTQQPIPEVDPIQHARSGCGARCTARRHNPAYCGTSGDCERVRIFLVVTLCLIV